MNIGAVLFTILLLVIVPCIVGSLFVTDGFSKNRFGKIVWSWLFGQLLLWCVFQLIAVRDVMVSNTMDHLVKWYGIAFWGLMAIALIALCIRGIIYLGRKKKTKQKAEQLTNAKSSIVKSENNKISTEQLAIVKSKMDKKDRLSLILWIAFGVLLVVQMILQGTLSYIDGDDAFYVAQATSAAESNRLFWFLPYTGAWTGYDMRHALAPFSLWIAWISRMTGIVPVSIAHVLVPIVLLPMGYAAYGVFGERLLVKKGKNYLPVFMLIISILTIFSGYSAKITEKFLVTRLRQGKAMLAGIVLPMLFVCLYMLLEALKEKKQADFRLYILLFALNVSGCLGSTMGALLCLIPIGVFTILVAIMYKRWQHILPIIACCIPSLIYAFMYVRA